MNGKMPQRSRLEMSLLSFLVYVLLLNVLCGCWANESLEGRFSFSLSTFDPSGKIGQVDRALIASSLGTPIVAVIKNDRILLSAPQILPSPLMEDDGTSRFSAVTPHIAVGHSGISADGRVLVAAAQQLAVEHAYTYDENISIELFLEEMSLLFQEYTMTPGVRPFGAILLVAHTPREGKPQLFRVDPSGSVTSYTDNVAIINGKFKTNRGDLEASLDKISRIENSTISEDEEELSNTLERILTPKPLSDGMESLLLGANEGDQTLPLPSAIVTASLTRQFGLRVERRKITSTLPPTID